MIEIDCNWKTSVDAFNEAYHVAATHPQTLEFTDDVNVPIDCYALHTRMLFREAIASPRHPGHGTLTPLLRQYFLNGAGIDGDRTGTGLSIVRALVHDELGGELALENDGGLRADVVFPA